MGSRFSIPAVGKALKSNENTVASYLNFLCDSYICVDVRNFSYSLKETSRSQHKCYFIDNGLVSANVFRYSPQSGSALENLGLSLKPWGIALKFLFLHHENILFPND